MRLLPVWMTAPDRLCMFFSRLIGAQGVLRRRSFLFGVSRMRLLTWPGATLPSAPVFCIAPQTSDWSFACFGCSCFLLFVLGKRLCSTPRFHRSFPCAFSFVCQEKALGYKRPPPCTPPRSHRPANPRSGKLSATLAFSALIALCSPRGLVLLGTSVLFLSRS